MNASDAKKLTTNFLRKYDSPHDARIEIDRINLQIKSAANQGYSKIELCKLKCTGHLVDHFHKQGFSVEAVRDGDDGGCPPQYLWRLTIRW